METQLAELLNALEQSTDPMFQQIVILEIQSTHNVNQLIQSLSFDARKNVIILFVLEKMINSFTNSSVQELLTLVSRGTIPTQNYPKLAYIVAGYMKSYNISLERMAQNIELPTRFYLLLNINIHRKFVLDRRNINYDFQQLLMLQEHTDLVLELMELYYQFQSPREYFSLIHTLEILLTACADQKLLHLSYQVLETVINNFNFRVDDMMRHFIGNSTKLILSRLGGAQCASLSYEQIKYTARLSCKMFAVCLNVDLKPDDQIASQSMCIFNILMHHKSIQVFEQCITFINKLIFQATPVHSVLGQLDTRSLFDQILYFSDPSNYTHILAHTVGDIHSGHTDLSEVEQFMQYDLQLEDRAQASEQYYDMQERLVKVVGDLTGMDTIKCVVVELAIGTLLQTWQAVSAGEGGFDHRLYGRLQAIYEITDKVVEQLVNNGDGCYNDTLQQILSNEHIIHLQQYSCQYIDFLSKVLLRFMLCGHNHYLELFRHVFKFLINNMAVQYTDSNVFAGSDQQQAQQGIFDIIQSIVDQNYLQTLFNHGAESAEQEYNYHDISLLVSTIGQLSNACNKFIKMQYDSLVVQIQLFFQLKDGGEESDKISSQICYNMSQITSLSLDQVRKSYFSEHDGQLEIINNQNHLNILLHLIAQATKNEQQYIAMQQHIVELFCVFLRLQYDAVFINQNLIPHNYICKVTDTNKINNLTFIINTVTQLLQIILDARKAKSINESLQLLKSTRLNVCLVWNIMDTLYRVENLQTGCLDQVCQFLVVVMEACNVDFRDENYVRMFLKYIEFQYTDDIPDIVASIRAKVFNKIMDCFITLGVCYQYEIIPSQIVRLSDICTENSISLCRLSYLLQACQDKYQYSEEVIRKLFEIIFLQRQKHTYVMPINQVLATYLTEIKKSPEGCQIIVRSFPLSEDLKSTFVQELSACRFKSEVHTLLVSSVASMQE